MATVIVNETFETLSEENRGDNIVTQIIKGRVLDCTYGVRNVFIAAPVNSLLLWAKERGCTEVPLIHVELYFDEGEVSKEYLDEGFSIVNRMADMFGGEFQCVFALRVEDGLVHAHLLVCAVSMHNKSVMHVNRLLADEIFCHAFNVMREFNLDTFRCFLR